MDINLSYSSTSPILIYSSKQDIIEKTETKDLCDDSEKRNNTTSVKLLLDNIIALLLSDKGNNKSLKEALRQEACRIVIPLILCGLKSKAAFFRYESYIRTLASEPTDQLKSQIHFIKQCVRYFFNYDQSKSRPDQSKDKTNHWLILCDLIKQNMPDNKILSEFGDINAKFLTTLCQMLRKAHENHQPIQKHCASDYLTEYQQKLLNSLAIGHDLIAYQLPDITNTWGSAVSQEQLGKIIAIMQPDIFHRIKKTNPFLTETGMPILIKPCDNDPVLKLILTSAPRPFSLLITGNDHTIGIYGSKDNSVYCCDINHLNNHLSIAAPIKLENINSTLWKNLVSCFEESRKLKHLLCSVRYFIPEHPSKKDPTSKLLAQKKQALITTIKVIKDTPLQETLLDMLVQHNDGKAIRQLLKNNSLLKKSLLKPDIHSLNPLALAITDNAPQATQAIIQVLGKTTLIKPILETHTPLQLAAYHGSLEVIQILHSFLEPIQWIKLCQQKTIHVDHHGFTPLWLAATLDRCETFCYFVKSLNTKPQVLHPLLTACNDQKQPLISVIAGYGYNDPLLILIEALKGDKKALTQPDQYGLTPLDWAKKNTQETGLSLCEEILYNAIHKRAPVPHQSKNCVIL